MPLHFDRILVGTVVAMLLMTQIGAAQSLDDARDLESFVDGLMAAQMKQDHVPGATISIVEDGKIIFAKGYGYSDLETFAPVDPETTLFRVASITKTFTWLAVMQQVERGNLDLNTDVNTYLKNFTVPEAFDQPITINHLMSHTPGLADRVVGLFARDDERVLPLPEIFNAEFPIRVRPPGQLGSYSNHGAALAGHLVALKSGMTWEDYIEKEIFKPLGMTNASCRQPLEPRLAPNLSKGYAYRKASFEEENFQYMPLAPAGIMSLRATAMAKYMIALIDYGAYVGPEGQGRLLERATAEEMFSQNFTHHPAVAGMAHGFFEHHYGGGNWLGHGGSTVLFFSYYAFDPVSRVGIFVAENSDIGAALPGKIIRPIIERYYPLASPEKIAPSYNASEDVQKVAGTYASLRHDHESPAKLAAMMPMSLIKVAAKDDGSIVVTSGGGLPSRYVTLEPSVYRQELGHEIIAFGGLDSGRATHAFRENNGAIAYERARLIDTMGFTMLLLGVVVVSFVGTIVVWPIRGIIRLVRGSKQETENRWHALIAALLRATGWIVCVMHLTFLARFAGMMEDPNEIVYGLSQTANSVLRSSLGTALQSLVLALNCFIAFSQRYWTLGGRLYYAWLVVCAGLLVWWEWYWQLLSFPF